MIQVSEASWKRCKLAACTRHPLHLHDNEPDSETCDAHSIFAGQRQPLYDKLAGTQLARQAFRSDIDVRSGSCLGVSRSVRILDCSWAANLDAVMLLVGCILLDRRGCELGRLLAVLRGMAPFLRLSRRNAAPGSPQDYQFIETLPTSRDIH